MEMTIGTKHEVSVVVTNEITAETMKSGRTESTAQILYSLLCGILKNMFWASLYVSW